MDSPMMRSEKGSERAEAATAALWADLGFDRREQIITADRKRYREAHGNELERLRASNLRGTKEHKVAQNNKEAISAWSTLWQQAEDVEPEDAIDVHTGQAHRLRVRGELGGKESQGKSVGPTRGHSQNLGRIQSLALPSLVGPQGKTTLRDFLTKPTTKVSEGSHPHASHAKYPTDDGGRRSTIATLPKQPVPLVERAKPRVLQQPRAHPSRMDHLSQFQGQLVTGSDFMANLRNVFGAKDTCVTMQNETVHELKYTPKYTEKSIGDVTNVTEKRGQENPTTFFQLPTTQPQSQTPVLLPESEGQQDNTGAEFSPASVNSNNSSNNDQFDQPLPQPLRQDPLVDLEEVQTPSYATELASLQATDNTTVPKTPSTKFSQGPAVLQHAQNKDTTADNGLHELQIRLGSHLDDEHVGYTLEKMRAELAGVEKTLKALWAAQFPPEPHPDDQVPRNLKRKRSIPAGESLLKVTKAELRDQKDTIVGETSLNQTHIAGGLKDSSHCSLGEGFSQDLVKPPAESRVGPHNLPGQLSLTAKKSSSQASVKNEVRAHAELSSRQPHSADSTKLLEENLQRFHIDEPENRGFYQDKTQIVPTSDLLEEKLLQPASKVRLTDTSIEIRRREEIVSPQISSLPITVKPQALAVDSKLQNEQSNAKKSPVSVRSTVAAQKQSKKASRVVLARSCTSIADVKALFNQLRIDRIERIAHEVYRVQFVSHEDAAKAFIVASSPKKRTTCRATVTWVDDSYNFSEDSVHDGPTTATFAGERQWLVRYCENVDEILDLIPRNFVGAIENIESLAPYLFTVRFGKAKRAMHAMQALPKFLKENRRVGKQCDGPPTVSWMSRETISTNARAKTRDPNPQGTKAKAKKPKSPAKAVQEPYQPPRASGFPAKAPVHCPTTRPLNATKGAKLGAAQIHVHLPSQPMQSAHQDKEDPVLMQSTVFKAEPSLRERRGNTTTPTTELQLHTEAPSLAKAHGQVFKAPPATVNATSLLPAKAKPSIFSNIHREDPLLTQSHGGGYESRPKPAEAVSSLPTKAQLSILGAAHAKDVSLAKGHGGGPETYPKNDENAPPLSTKVKPSILGGASKWSVPVVSSDQASGSPDNAQQPASSKPSVRDPSMRDPEWDSLFKNYSRNAVKHTLPEWLTKESQPNQTLDPGAAARHQYGGT